MVMRVVTAMWVRSRRWRERIVVVGVWCGLMAWILAQADYGPVRSAAESAERTAAILAQMHAWRQAQERGE